MSVDRQIVSTTFSHIVSSVFTMQLNNNLHRHIIMSTNVRLLQQVAIE